MLASARVMQRVTFSCTGGFMEFFLNPYFIIFCLASAVALRIVCAQKRVHAVHPMGRGTLIVLLLLDIMHRSKSATIQHAPPQSGPALAMISFTANDFMCECYRPVNWREERDDVPSPLCVVSGFIEKLNANMQTALAPLLRKSNGAITRIGYTFSMSCHRNSEKRVARGMHYELDIEFANGDTHSFKNCHLGEREIAESGIDKLFRSFFVSETESRG
jgi:hypothetical protein